MAVQGVVNQRGEATLPLLVGNRPVGKQKQGIATISYLFLYFNPLVNTKAISSIN